MRLCPRRLASTLELPSRSMSSTEQNCNSGCQWKRRVTSYPLNIQKYTALPLLPHVTMAAPLGPLSDPGAEKSLLKINQDLQSQLEKSKQDFRDLKEKFLISEATAYSLANQLQKYKCEESSDIIESVLGEKGQLEKRERADTLAEKLRQCHLLIKDQTEELTRLYDKLLKGRDVCQLLDKHLEDLLSHDDPEHCQGQGFQEQLAEGRRLAKCLARKLSSENYDEEEDEHEEETRTPSVEQEEVEKKEVLQDRVDDCDLTPSVLEEGCDSDQSYSDENEIDQEGPKGQESVAPRLSGQLLEVVEQVGSWDSADNNSLTYSVLPELSDSYQPYRSAAIFSPEDLEVCSSLEVAKNEIDQEGPKGQESVAPRLSGQLLEVVEQVVISRASPDKHYLTYSVLPEMSDSYWPYRSAAIFSPEDLEVCSSLEVAKNQISHKEEEDQDPLGPRLTTELPEVEEDTPSDSLDECYLTYSALPDRSDSLGTCGKADITSLEDLDICSALEVANSHNDLVEEEDQGRICPSPACHTRLHRELPVAEENEDPQDSLDDCYLTSSFGHDPPDTCRPYTSASFTFDKQETFLGLDVDAPMQAPCHQGPLSGNVTFQRAEVQMSGAQTQPSTQVANSLRQQLKQQLDCGDNRARLGLSSAIGSLDAKMGSGNQWPLFQELGLDASLCVKNPPKLEGDATEASRDSQCECQAFGHRKALGVMKEKIPKRKLQFGQWRLACRFRGPQA
ncbi:neuroblastoma breakpoint family member 6-like [Ursus arctos]|uniref:neuroblastoma breakpoint family member 6-like n=1 Tax=Ursus arctos TaxID=9644 RepID=UPI002547B7DF|nr:neuroblastoma breakpoint family member 6-like [Ursus arctos]